MARVTLGPPPSEDDPIFREQPTAYTPRLGRVPTKRAMQGIDKVIDKLLARHPYPRKTNARRDTDDNEG